MAAMTIYIKTGQKSSLELQAIEPYLRIIYPRDKIFQGLFVCLFVVDFFLVFIIIIILLKFGSRHHHITYEL